MTNSTEIGETIRKYRKAKGFTQKQLAEKLGKVESTVRMWELGKNNPLPDILKKLSKVLDVSYTELMEKAGYLKSFGHHIKDLREEKNLSITELARRSGVSNDYLLKLEAGKTQKPSYEIIGKIAKGFNINTAELLNEPDSSLHRTFDGNDLSYTDITEMNEEQRNDFGRMFYENREGKNLSYEEISFKTGIPEKDIELLEKGLLNRNLTEIESINLLQSFRGFEFYVVPRNDAVIRREFEIGNLILFNHKVNYKGEPLTFELRKSLFEVVKKVMEQKKD